MISHPPRKSVLTTLEKPAATAKFSGNGFANSAATRFRLEKKEPTSGARTALSAFSCGGERIRADKAVCAPVFDPASGSVENGSSKAENNDGTDCSSVNGTARKSSGIGVTLGAASASDG